MRERNARLWGSLAAGATVVVLLTGSSTTAPHRQPFVPTTASLLTAMAGALGGSARIDKITTIYFQWHVLGMQIENAGQQTVGGMRTHQHAREWMTADGYDRLEAVTAGMQGAPVLRVFTPGASHESVSITVTNASRYVPPANAEQCSSSTGGICVRPTEVYFDKVSPGVPPEARIQVSETGYSGSFSESDACAGIASIAPLGHGTQPALFSVTPQHAGHCSIDFGSTSPHGWMLVGDQGWPSGNSTGALQGPDLSREISYVYWMTFAYLHPGGLPGSARYVPIHGADEYELDLQPQGGEPIEAYINSKTYLPDKIQIGSDPYKMVVIPSDWKPTTGVLFPTTMTVQLFDSEMQMKYSLVKVELDQKFNMSLFAQPVPSL